ncbi:MAG TPA: replication-relaxation family protein [Acidobacteriota bacterium]|nr:replication-relaxation family protein [Acidobacteriota bacterium]
MKLLLALNRFRIARTSDLASVCFRGVRRDTAAARLRKLYDAHVLEVRAGAPNQESWYLVGPAGRRALEDRGTPVGRVPRGGLDHHLAIVWTWATVATAPSGPRLIRALPDWELREGGTSSDWGIVPDLLLVLGGEGVTRVVAVEVDLGTERLAEVESKVRRYGTLGEALGCGELDLLFLTRSAERAVRIRTILGQGFAGRSATCDSMDDLPSALLQLLAPPPLAASPCSKGREAGTTRSPASENEAVDATP